MSKKPLVRINVDDNVETVRYKRKKWNVYELAEFLAQQVKLLEKNQCKPDIKCLFEAQDYIDNNY